MKEISIIIPCYNCADTLEEAVASVFRQGLNDFEIIMVDDGSTDNTKDIMKRLREKHKEIKIFFHEKNKGGGAARNTATKNSSSEVIFCLDSDDMLGTNALSYMLALQKKTGADGIAVGKSTKFIGKDVNLVSYVNNFHKNGEPITFESLFDTSKEGSCPLYSTFMYTKKSFEIAGGYPEHHGFDTQSFAFRFLSNGLRAYTCKEAEYLHRVKYKKSYYTRENAAGKVSLNFYYVYSEFYYLWSTEMKEILLTTRFDDYTYSLQDRLKDCKIKMIPNYKDFIINNSKDVYKNKIAGEPHIDKYDAYWLGEEALQKKDFEKSLIYLQKSLGLGLKYPRVYAHMFMSSCKIETNDDLMKLIPDILNIDRVIPPPVPESPTLLQRFLKKIKK